MSSRARGWELDDSTLVPDFAMCLADLLLTDSYTFIACR